MKYCNATCLYKTVVRYTHFLIKIIYSHNVTFMKGVDATLFFY